ncbi:glycoside hydrolase family 79 protein [Suillus lakei]|nr:glycoside hydrolase family 79 protein [Suillus lakei]
MWFLSTVLRCVALASARHVLVSRDGTSLSKLTLSGPASLPIDATPPLNPALASFSIETAFFEEYMGNQSYPNKLSQNLFENLKERTGVPAEVRIGGITADSTFWDPNQEDALYNFIDGTGALRNTTLGPQFWNSVKLLPEGTKIVMTLDLESLNYTGALDMAEAAWTGLGSRQISRFEIGNEPDQYYLNLNAQNYTATWEPWTINISKALGIDYPEFQVGATAIDPLWPYNTPQADAQFDCVSALAAGANDGHTVTTCSEHTYQYSVCDPTRAAVATLTNLVNHTRLAEYLDLWQPRIHSVRAQLGPDAFVIGEFNSVSCSGLTNVSNTFGQAMWLLDTTLYAASINVSRVYVHQGGPLALQSSTQLNHGGLSLYNLWYPVDNQNGPIQVFPSYSAYLFVTEAIGHSRSLCLSNIFPGRQANGSSITTAGGDPSAGQISVYGFWDENSTNSNDYPTKLALLNLEIYNQTDSHPRPNITIDVSAYLPKTQEVIVKRLTAPGADVLSSNVTTWAGQTFASGVAEGNIVEEKVSNGQVVVEASSAALVYW